MSFNYYFQIPLIILITFIVTKIIKFTLYYAFRFWNKRNSIFITSIIISIKKPIIYFLWFYSILISINILLSRFYKKFNYNSTSNIVVFVIYTTILVILIRNISQIKKKISFEKIEKK
jgi:hypothetical protein